MTSPRTPWLSLSLWLSLLGAASCGEQTPVGELSQGLTDERWWMNPLFPGSTKYHYADGHDWYDSDIGGSYVTGSYVRLPVDANYIGDWNTGPVHCTNGTTSTFWSPIFQTTVNGVTTNWVFNHLSQSFLGANGRTKGWYNGGALVGLTGGGTCDTGYPTYSTGPHFCNEMRDYDPYTYWKPVANYTSSCTGSNGTSGVANPVCGGTVNDPCSSASAGNGLYCGGGLSGGNASLLYNCQNKKTASTTPCSCGCVTMPMGVNDACKTGCGDPCGSAKFGNGGYCGGGLTNGDPALLYQCANGVTTGTTLCKCGCAVMPNGVNDVCSTMCAPPADLLMSTNFADLAVAPVADMSGSGGSTDLAGADLAGADLRGAQGGGDGGSGTGADLAQPNNNTGATVHSGCSVVGSGEAGQAVPLLMLCVLASLGLVLRRRRRGQRERIGSRNTKDETRGRSGWRPV